ncbi:hypothetical protein AN1V17_21960 [Vallitalea sediminicola]
MNLGELYEETGVIEYNLLPICNYSVEIDESKSFGRLYYAEVKNISQHYYLIVK